MDALNKENSELLRKMSNAATTEEYNTYRTKYENNKKKINELQSQLDSTNDIIVQTKQAIKEAEDGEKAQTDDYNRIPQLMKAMKDAYGIAWTDNGSWTGYTFIRHGTVGSVKGEVIFSIPFHCEKTEVFPGHQDTPCNRANRLAIDEQLE